MILRFFGMYSPFENLRIAMYRKAGIKIGRVRQFGRNIYLDVVDNGSITICDGVVMHGYNYILSHSFMLDGIRDNEGYSPVTIKKGARISIGVTILRGVTIGENAVIGAGALVTRNIPDNCIAYGIPAKPVSYHSPPK
jgi:acetyltransferase-like isoleucine patch superfamily enzyme